MRRVILLAAIATAVIPGFAHRVRVDFDHNIRTCPYRTYSWAGLDKSQAAFLSQLMQERVTGFIEQALAARGYKRVASGGDLLVSYGVNITEQPIFNTFSTGDWWSGFSTTTVQTIYDGTLIVDMVDAKKNQLIFQGASTQTVSSRPDRNTRRLARAVNEIFQRYPFRPQQ